LRAAGACDAGISMSELVVELHSFMTSRSKIATLDVSADCLSGRVCRSGDLHPSLKGGALVRHPRNIGARRDKVGQSHQRFG